MATKKKLQTSVPGRGFIYRPSYTYKGKKLQSTRWMIRLEDGTQISTKTKDQEAAYAQLLQTVAAQESGKVVSVRGTVGELFDLAIEDGKLKGNRSFADKKRKIELLRKEIGHIKIRDFRAADIVPWLSRKQIKKPGQKSETATLGEASKNRYLSEIRHAFKMGMEADPQLCSRIPKLPHFEEDNVREGILERADYERFRDSFTKDATHAKLFFVLAYHLGMRRGELLLLKWPQVDLVEGVIRLRKKQTKGKKDRVAPIYGDMREYLRMALESKAPGCDCVIQYEGHPVRELKRSWASACRMSGITIKPHDLRRTAACNLIDAGVSESSVMAITGHATNSMFIRYQISTVKRAQAVGVKMDAWMEETKTEAAPAKGTVN